MFKKLFRLSNLGIFAYFILNFSLIVLLFGNGNYSNNNLLILIAIYTGLVLVSLTSLGEWVLSVLYGARNLKYQAEKIRVIPLLDVVLERARILTPNLPRKINIKIIETNEINAYALGRKTIMITSGLLSLDDMEIMAILAHEVGHLAYGHTVVELLIGGSNIFITGFLILLRIGCWIITGLLATVSLISRSWFFAFFASLISGILFLSLWLWSKFSMLFLKWSMRQNEYEADAYAFELGFGVLLAELLLGKLNTEQASDSIFRILDADHPSNYDRANRLMDLESQYLGVLA